MSLRIPATARCLVPSCRGTPTHKLGLRMRRQDSGADWAPDTEAYFCTAHATSGAEIIVLYAPNVTKEVTVSVTATKIAKRTTPITRA